MSWRHGRPAHDIRGGLSPLDNMPLSHAGGLLKTDEQLPISDLYQYITAPRCSCGSGYAYAYRPEVWATHVT